MFAKRHYEFLAASLRHSKVLIDEASYTADDDTCERLSRDQHDHPRRADAWRTSVESLAYALARDNSRFDRARFLKACGVEE